MHHKLECCSSDQVAFSSTTATFASAVISLKVNLAKSCPTFTILALSIGLGNDGPVLLHDEVRLGFRPLCPLSFGVLLILVDGPHGIVQLRDGDPLLILGLAQFVEVLLGSLPQLFDLFV